MDSKEEYKVRIGKNLKEIFEKLKKKINNYAYDSLKISDYEVSEVLAKKINESKIV